MRTEARLFALISVVFTLNSILLPVGVLPALDELGEQLELDAVLKRQIGEARKCSSREFDVPFPYGTCKSPVAVTSFAPDTQVTCGMCHQNTWVAALEDLSERLEDLVGDTCSEMVVYGVAFGHMYESMIEKHPKCTFMFLLDRKKQHDMSLLRSPVSLVPHLRIEENGKGYIIRVPPKFLPYANNRRNTKLLKLFGGLKVFNFAKRVVWQDAKLFKVIDGPDYEDFFEENIDNTGTCASFRGMPAHINTVGKSAWTGQGVQFHDHCDVLLKVNRKSSPITDSRESVRYQCKLYETQTNATSDQLSLDSGMIDSALILWDMRSERCRKFNLELSCTWLDETQCYGDRDQISFPQALRNLPLSEKHAVAPVEAMTRDRLFQLDDDAPAVHISRGACHWYYIEDNDLMECKNNVRKEYDVKPKRVAVVVAGGLLRFNFNSTIHHLIRPMADQGHHVDYYLSLSSNIQRAYRATSQYMDHLVVDPVLPPTADSLASTVDFIEKQVIASGGTPRTVVFDRPLHVDEHPLLKARRAAAMESHPREDPDMRFPMLDIRTATVRSRTARGNKNMYALFYNIQSLWKDLVDTESEEEFQYDFVFFLRDDTMWLMDFDFNELISSNKPSTELFSLSCDARQPAMHPLEINDHIAIVKRNRAEMFGNYFEHLFDEGIEDCSDQLDREFTWGGRRGCNSEMILKWMLKNAGVEIASVPQATIPFQRSVHVETSSGVIEPCFHKLCQSHDMPIPDFGISRCSDVFEAKSVMR